MSGTGKKCRVGCVHAQIVDPGIVTVCARRERDGLVRLVMRGADAVTYWRAFTSSLAKRSRPTFLSYW